MLSFSSNVGFHYFHSVFPLIMLSSCINITLLSVTVFLCLLIFANLCQLGNGVQVDICQFRVHNVTFVNTIHLL